MALINTLTEDWTTIDEVNKWNKWGGAQITNPDGVLTFTSVPNTTNYYGIASLATYDLTGVAMPVEIVAVPDILTGDDEVSFSCLNLEINADNRYFWEWNINGLAAMKVTAGAYNQIAIVGKATFSLTTHKYIRIREDAGTVYYDYSANGYDWTNLTSIATTGVAVTALYYAHAIGHYAATANTYVAKIDNTNLMPAAPAPAPTNTGNMLMMFM